MSLTRTFNTIGSTKGEFGGGIAIWSRVNKVYQGGGTIDVSSMSAGTVIPAGTMVHFAGAGKEVEIIAEPKDLSTVTKDELAELAKVNGLILNDVCVPEGCVLATCAVCMDGRIYADRVGKGLPKEIEAQLPAIEFVRE